MQALEIDSKKCAACETCELVCAIRHFKVNNPKKAAIRIRESFSDPTINRVFVCRQCEERPCLDSCTTNAIAEDDRGILRVEAKECTKCLVCIDVCPYEAIFTHPELGWVLMCDLCGGDPECAKWCPTKAIKSGG
ncbi:MAG: 4Fe-4S dicluster domain-containing protein [Candidatus Geothermarchaeales archaeon]